MVPSDAKLVQAIRRAAAALADPAHQAVVGAIDVALNELALRTDASFYADHYGRGRTLADEGAALGLADDGLARRIADLPEAIDPDLGSVVIGRFQDGLDACLAEIADGAGAPRDGVRKDYLARLTDWETSRHQHQLESRDAPGPGGAGGDSRRERLEEYLRRRFREWKDLEVTAFQPLHGGFSKQTILFSTHDRVNGTQDLVIRAEQEADIIRLDGGSLDNEFRVLSLAHAAGIHMPEPLWLEEDASVLGRRFVVSRRASGRVYGTVASAAESLPDELLMSVVAELAKIHAVRLDPSSDAVERSHLANWLRFATVAEAVRRHVEYWFELVEIGPSSPSPTIRRVLHWLRDNVPQCDDPPVFLHGDYGLHNLLLEDHRVSAVLDWEGSRVGDPADELSWFLMGAERYVPRERLFALYRTAGGKPFTARRVRYHDVLNHLKMVVVCNVALARLEELGENLNLAVIGLRFAYPFASRLNELITRAESEKD